jgi:hypothetical protein
LRLWLSPHRPGRCHLPRPPNTATTVVRFCTSAIEIVIGTEIAIGMADAIEATPIGIDHIIDPTVTISPMVILTISPTAIMGTPTITAGQASASSSDSKWGIRREETVHCRAKTPSSSNWQTRLRLLPNTMTGQKTIFESLVALWRGATTSQESSLVNG